MGQNLSNEGLAFLASHEGIVPAPYRDSVGVLTWGVGHTRAAGSPDPASLPMAMPSNLDEALRRVLRTFRMDVAKYEADVRRAVKVPMSQHEFDAAVSFHFNTGAISRASWVKKWNAGDRAGAIKAIMNWTKPPEIKSRRQAERNLFARGTYGAVKATVWGTDGNGRVIWKPVRTLSQPQLLALMNDASPPVRPDVEPAPTPTIPAEVQAVVDDADGGGLASTTNIATAASAGTGIITAIAALDPLVAVVVVVVIAAGAFWVLRERQRKAALAQVAKAAL